MSRKSERAGEPDPVDVHVGNRVRFLRTLKGYSQERLGRAVGLTFQQIQKYERGTNRIGASRLYDLAQALDVPVQFFFDEMPRELAQAGHMSSRRTALWESGSLYVADPVNTRETLEFVRAYHQIASETLRRRLFEMTKAIASAVGYDE